MRPSAKASMSDASSAVSSAVRPCLAAAAISGGV